MAKHYNTSVTYLYAERGMGFCGKAAVDAVGSVIESCDGRRLTGEQCDYVMQYDPEWHGEGTTEEEVREREATAKRTDEYYMAIVGSG